MAAIIGSNQAARLAGLARKKVLEKRLTKTGQMPRLMYDFMQSRKKTTQFTGDGVLIGIKEPAYNIAGQEWSGSDSLNNPVEVQNTLWTTFSSSNFFNAIKWGFDDLRKVSGVTILPNDNGKSLDARAVRRDPSSERVLYNRLTEDTQSWLARNMDLLDLRMHRQGSSSKGLYGLNGILPIRNYGYYGGAVAGSDGLNRGTVRGVQHVLFAGASGNIAGCPWMGPRGTTGSSGTLLTQLKKFFRQVRVAARMSGLPRGNFRCFAGQGFLDKLGAQIELKTAFQTEATNDVGKVQAFLTDERLGLGAKDMSLEWDNTLDEMDTVASSEVGVGMSQLTLTFSGGGSPTRLPQAIAYVAADGTIAGVSVTDPGEGLTAAPSIAIGNAGSGTNGSITCTVYSASSGAGLTQVDGDDVRIGRLATVTIANAGSGYPTTGIAAPFTDRMYCLYEPSWDYLVQEGLDEFLSVPCDQPRQRLLESQFDHTDCLTCNCPRANGVFVAADS
jgi:hypothetical protein